MSISATCPFESVKPRPYGSFAEIVDRFEREALHQVIDLGRYRSVVHCWGEGPALVFVPGLCLEGRSFLALMAHLSESFRCIAYDLPNGRSDGARLARYRHGNLVQDVRTLLDRLAINEAYLYGCSFGSTIALAALAEAPARFPCGILQGGFARRRLAPGEVALAKFARYWPWPLHRLPGWLTAATQSHAPAFSGREPGFWSFFLDAMGKPPMTAIAHRALILNDIDMRSRLPHIRQPVLMICGDADTLVGKDCEGDLLRGLSRVARAELERCGHFPQLTHPEMVSEIIRSFLLPRRCDSQVSSNGA